MPASWLSGAEPAVWHQAWIAGWGSSFCAQSSNMHHQSTWNLLQTRTKAHQHTKAIRCHQSQPLSLAGKPFFSACEQAPHSERAFSEGLGLETASCVHDHKQAQVMKFFHTNSTVCQLVKSCRCRAAICNFNHGEKLADPMRRRTSSGLTKVNFFVLQCTRVALLDSFQLDGTRRTKNDILRCSWKFAFRHNHTTEVLTLDFTVP